VAATFVTVSELRADLGIGTLYSDAVIDEVCQTAQDLISQFLWFNTAPVVATSLTSNVATVTIAASNLFVTGQTVTIAGSGVSYNGTRVITGMGPASVGSNNLFIGYPFNYPRGYQFLQFAITGTDESTHLVQPYGLMTGPDHKTQSYATTPGVRQASMILAVSIWQARQSTQTGGMSVDGYSPSPFKMSNTLMASIRGLVAPYLSPASMVG